MTEHIIRTFCWHMWNKWSTPQTMTWVNYETSESYGVMCQRRECGKCGKVRYRKCS